MRLLSSQDSLYDLSGNVVTEWCTNCGGYTGPTTEYIFMGGRFVAEYNNSTTYFAHRDHLGSTRLMTDLNQAVVQNLDYLPFGELNSSDSGITTHKFTSKERDSESGLDNFGARFNSSSLGRFISPDETLVDQQAEDPQSWNLYSYVRNNPLINRDEDGQECTRDKDGNLHGDCSSPGDEKVTQGDKPQTVQVSGTTYARFWGDAQYHQFLNKQFDEYNKTHNVKVVRAEIPFGPGEFKTLAELAEELLLSKNNLKHILKHLAEFQKHDPQMDIKEVVQIGEDVIKTGTPVKANSFVKSVLIGGKEIMVRAVVNANNMLRTVYPLN